MTATRAEFEHIRRPNAGDMSHARGNRFDPGAWVGSGSEMFLRSAAVDRGRMAELARRPERQPSSFGGDFDVPRARQSAAAGILAEALEGSVPVRLAKAVDQEWGRTPARHNPRWLVFTPDPPLDVGARALLAAKAEADDLPQAPGLPGEDDTVVRREAAPGGAVAVSVSEAKLRLVLWLVGAWDAVRWAPTRAGVVFLRGGKPIAVVARLQDDLFLAPPPAPDGRLVSTPWLPPAPRGRRVDVAELPRALGPGVARAAWLLEGDAGDARWVARVQWEAGRGLTAVGRQRGAVGEWVVSSGESPPDPGPWNAFAGARAARGGTVRVARATPLWRLSAPGQRMGWREAAAALDGRPAAVTVDRLRVLGDDWEEPGDIVVPRGWRMHLVRLGGAVLIALDDRVVPLADWAAAWRRVTGEEPGFCGLVHGMGPNHHFFAEIPSDPPPAVPRWSRVVLDAFLGWRDVGRPVEELPTLARRVGPGAVFVARGLLDRDEPRTLREEWFEVAAGGELLHHAEAVCTWDAPPAWPATLPVAHGVERFEAWLARSRAGGLAVEEVTVRLRVVPVPAAAALREAGEHGAAPRCAPWQLPPQPAAPRGVRYIVERPPEGSAAIYEAGGHRFLPGGFVDAARAQKLAARLDAAASLAAQARAGRQVW